MSNNKIGKAALKVATDRVRRAIWAAESDADCTGQIDYFDILAAKSGWAPLELFSEDNRESHTFNIGDKAYKVIRVK